jgi:hypothetical protein
MTMTPSYYATHYRTGEPIQAGDRVAWAGSPGTVVFVHGSPDVPAEWAWRGREGFMLEVESAGWVFQQESDEDLDFVGRRA